MLPLLQDRDEVTKLTSQMSKVRLVAPDEEDIAASPSLTRKMPEARLVASASLNPLLLSFIVKFFTFQVTLFLLALKVETHLRFWVEGLLIPEKPSNIMALRQFIAGQFIVGWFITTPCS